MSQKINALELAKIFHEKYERLAPSFGYETREDTKEFDPESKNGKLMVAVCEEIIIDLTKIIYGELHKAIEELTEEDLLKFAVHKQITFKEKKNDKI